MLARTILGTVGIAGLVAGIWILVYEARHVNGHQAIRDRFYSWLLSLDSFVAAIGWAMWMGLFGTFVSLSITGQGIV